MRLAIDLQGAQGESAARGIGRLSRELALAMSARPGPHEPVVLLNDAFPDTAELLGDLFARHLPRANIRVWRGMTGCGWRASPDRRRASELIRAQMLAGLDADIVHATSVVEGFDDDVVAAWPATHERLPVAATFYDAIPLLTPQRYLADPSKASFYHRQLQELRSCTALLAISESSRMEAIELLGCDPEAVFNMRAGFDAGLFRPPEGCVADVLARCGVRPRYVLFVGAGEPRKNDLGLLRAYARLDPAVRRRCQLVIVGSGAPDQLHAEAAALGIAPDDLVLLRHVPDADLPALYGRCRCFVFPSFHEGFGLPALEAMACGAAVVASNRASLPEVVGLDAALFDPEDIGAMAALIGRVLTDDAFHDMLAAHGRRRAAGFGWPASAALAWRALEATLDRVPAGRRRAARAGAPVRRKPSLAFVGPLPPDRSGIADYSRDLLPSLAQHYDLTLVTQAGVVEDAALTANFAVLDEAAFADAAETFDRIVYQAGNSEFHIGIVQRLLPAHPGVVALHDAFMSGIPLHQAVLAGDASVFARALFDSHGWGAVRFLADHDLTAAAQRFPCLLPVFRHALGVLQHSQHGRDIVAGALGAPAAGLVRLVPFARATWRLTGRQAARAALGLPADAVIVCSFGIVAPTKRPLDVIEAFHAGFAGDPAALLAFVGFTPSDQVDVVDGRAAELGIAHRVVRAGRVMDERYRHWLEAADIALQLRTASRGETSAAIADCLAAGLPTVVNAHGSAAELPGDVVVMLPDLATTHEIGAAAAALWADPARRRALGARAARHARAVMSPTAVARAYRDAIEAFYARGPAARLRAALPSLPAADLRDAARALAVSLPAFHPPRLLLAAPGGVGGAGGDGAGVPRMVREVARRVLLRPPHGTAADAVRFDGGVLRHARHEAAGLAGVLSHGLGDPPAMASPGDTIVLMGDAALEPAELLELRRLRRQGARLVVVVYHTMQRSLGDALAAADLALCVSRALADELPAWLACSGVARHGRLAIDWFPGAGPPDWDEAAARFLARLDPAAPYRTWPGP